MRASPCSRLPAVGTPRLHEEDQTPPAPRPHSPGDRAAALLLADLASPAQLLRHRGGGRVDGGTVPHYITSNPWIANAYAQVVLGWLRDGPGGSTGAAGLYRRAGVRLRPFRVPVPQPAGGAPRAVGPAISAGIAGALRADRLHREQSRLPARSPLAAAAGRGRPARLRPLRRGGGGGDPAQPVRGGALAATLVNPLVVLANYVFDGVPQDCFAIRGGRLHESLATLTSPRGGAGPRRPKLISRVALTYEQRPARGGLLRRPGARRHPPGVRRTGRRYGVSLPRSRVAQRCATSADLAGGRLLLISADKGYSHEEQIAGREEPEVAVHGSFSMMVELPRLRPLAEAKGRGVPRRLPSPHQPQPHGRPAGRAPGGGRRDPPGLRGVGRAPGAGRLLRLKGSVGLAYEEISLEQLLAWMRISGLGRQHPPRLLAPADGARGLGAGGLPPGDRPGGHEVWEGHFPIRETRDLAFHLGVLLCEAGATWTRWGSSTSPWRSMARTRDVLQHRALPVPAGGSAGGARRPGPGAGGRAGLRGGRGAARGDRAGGAVTARIRSMTAPCRSGKPPLPSSPIARSERRPRRC